MKTRILILFSIFTLSFTVQAGYVTLSAINPGTLPSKSVTWDEPWWPWKGPDYIKCILTSPGGQDVKVSYNNVSHICQHYAGGTDEWGDKIPEIKGAGNVTLSFSNKNNISQNVTIEFLEDSSSGAWQTYGKTDFTIPAATNISARIQNSISVALKKKRIDKL